MTGQLFGNSATAQPSAIILGASSGIGLELTRHLATRNYRLAIAARRKPLLDELAASLPQIRCIQAMDVSRSDEARKCFQTILEAMAPVDFVYLCAGTGHPNPGLKWGLEEETIRVNVLGFAALASSALSFFLTQGHGHLVGITSVASVRGSAIAPAYGATKAFGSHYLEALRLRALQSRLPIFITEVRPGFVQTAMMKTNRPFWVASPAEAAAQIVAAVGARKPVAYVTRRWRLAAWVLQYLPDAIYAKLDRVDQVLPRDSPGGTGNSGAAG
jgi:short-subunit dehydrogenase